MNRAILTTLALLALSGCTPNQKTPDQIRQDATDATATASRGAATAVQDSKAALEGIQDGIKSVVPLNLNTASSADLQTLPGIDAAEAAKIIAARPYNSSGDLLTRHIMSKPEYDRISSRVVAH